MPLNVMDPRSGCCSVAIVRIRVDLPAPLGPSSPNMPLGTSRWISCIACAPPGYVFDRPVILSIGHPAYVVDEFGVSAVRKLDRQFLQPRTCVEPSGDLMT